MINSLNSLNELSDIYMGSISEEDNSPEAVKARVMQHVRAIRYRARKEGETLNKAYNEFMGSQSGISSTEKQMVKERLGLTGGSAHVGEETSLKDLRRASNLSTSDDPRDQDAAREIKTQMDYEDLLKQRGKKVKKESRVSWRDELREIASNIPVKEKQAERKVVEKEINNKIEINPTQTQAESFAKELGGELLEMYEVKEEENVDAGEVEDPRARAQEGREKRMKLRLLRLKMQSARQGVPGIVAHYEPEGDVISEKQKDTPDQVKAVIAYDKARKATDDAVYDTEHGKKKQAKKEKDYAKWQRDTGARDAQKSGHPWEHAKGSTREKEGKKSVKHAHVKDSYDPLEIQDANGEIAFEIVDVIKAPATLKASQPIPAVAEFNLTEEYITESADLAVNYFFEEGINEDGLDQIIEEVGIEEFVDFVLGEPEDLVEAKRVPGGGPYAAKKMNVRTLKATKKKAEEIKADKSDVVKRGTPKDTVARARAERSLKKPKLASPSTVRKAAEPKVPAAVAKVKKTQPKKKASKVGLLGKVKGTLAKGAERHSKAVKGLATKAAKSPVGKAAVDFAKGAGEGVKAVGKAAKDVYSVTQVNKKKTVNMQSYEPEGEVIVEKDLNAKERRALPDSDFALPGKGEGPEGKQAGSYPIPDEKHARSALSLVAQHGTAAEKATVRAAVKKKFPGIQQEAVDTAEKQKKAQAKAVLDRIQALKVGSKSKKEIGDLRKGAATLKGKYIARADSVEEGAQTYEKKKASEVLAAFRRDPKVRKRFEKAAKKGEGPGTVKNRAADDMLQTARDIAKRKGDTSKSDDRYAYESVDPAFDKVAGDLKKKFGSGVLVGKEKPPAPTEAQKKGYAAHKARIAAQDTRDDLEKSSHGRYSRKYSNRGSD